MAAKFKIDPNPTFKAEVLIPRIGGDPVPVNFTFKVLTRSELAAIYAQWFKRENEIQDMHWEELVAKTEAMIELDVTKIKDITVAWGWDEEFNDQNIRRMVETTAHASQAVVDVYQESYSEVRRGK